MSVPAYQMPAITGPPPGVGNTSSSGGNSNPVINDIGQLLTLGGAAYGLYNSTQQSNEAQTVYQQSNPFGGYRPYYGQQLMQLMQTPNAVTTIPGYNFLMGQGVQAIDRSSAAAGALGSGQEMTELETYGQGLADQFYQQQVATLAHLAGADINPANPAQALQATAGSNQGLGSSLTGLASTLGGGVSAATNLLSKLFPGQSGGSTPGALDYSLTNQDFSNLDPSTFNLSSPSTDFTDPYSMNITTPNSPLNLSQNTIDTSSFDGSTFDSGGGNLDLSGLFGNPSAAGGEAAGQGTGLDLTSIQNPSTGGLGLSSLGTGYGAYTGLTSGSPVGTTAGALDLSKLYGSYSGDAGVTTGSNLGLGGLGVYEGIEQGGASGDIQAGLGAAQVGGQAANAGLAGTGATAQALGTIGSSAAAVAPIVGLSIYAESTPAYTLGSAYYNRVNDTFNQTIQGGINNPDFISNYDELINAQGATNVGTNNANAAPLSPSQMAQLQAMYEDYLATNMPWITGMAPAGPLGRAASGGSGSVSQA